MVRYKLLKTTSITMSTKTAKHSLAYTIDWVKYQPYRAGIVVYTIYKETIYLALGLDALFKELTDFGGGVKYSKDGDAINGALREFMEESLYSFGVLDKKDLQYSLAIHDDNTVIFLYYWDVKPEQVVATFRRRVEVLPHPEVIDIVFISLSDFITKIKTEGVYSKVSELFISAGLFQ